MYKKRRKHIPLGAAGEPLIKVTDKTVEGTLGPEVITENGRPYILTTSSLMQEGVVLYCSKCRKLNPKTKVDKTCVPYCQECNTPLQQVRYIEK